MNHAPAQDQIEALRELGEGSAEILTLNQEAATQYANVDPKATPMEIRELAATILRSFPSIKEGPVVAVVQGHAILAVEIVKTLQKCGVSCYISTTERHSVETINDKGETVKTSVHKHVLFLPYPDLNS